MLPDRPKKRTGPHWAPASFWDQRRTSERLRETRQDSPRGRRPMGFTER